MNYNIIALELEYHGLWNPKYKAMNKIGVYVKI